MAELGAREREIMEVVMRLGRASAAEVRELLTGSPSDSSVRTMLALLERKGYLRHYRDGRRYIYEPAHSRAAVGKSALRHVVRTFFDGSTSSVITALIRDPGRKLTRDELDRLSKLVNEMKE
jgi:predicted transcriptional regulator